MNWPPIFIIRRIVNKLIVQRSPDIAEQPGVIVSFQNFLMPIVQVAVSDDEAISAGFKKCAMISGNTINNSGDTGDVLGPFPSGAIE